MWTKKGRQTGIRHGERRSGWRDSRLSSLISSGVATIVRYLLFTTSLILSSCGGVNAVIIFWCLHKITVYQRPCSPVFAYCAIVSLGLSRALSDWIFVDHMVRRVQNPLQKSNRFVCTFVAWRFSYRNIKICLQFQGIAPRRRDDGAFSAGFMKSHLGSD